MTFVDLKQLLISLWNNQFIQFLIATLGFIFAWWLITVIIKGFKKRLLKRGIDKLAVNAVFLFLLWGIRILLIIVYASIVGVDTAGFAAVISSAGLALGLALQGSLSNLAGGIVLVINRPFRLGDYIDVNGEVSGTIENMRLFYSELVTPDNKVIMVPNGKLANDIIINYSRKELRRVDFIFPISYDDNVEFVMNLIKDVAKSNQLILKDPALFVGEAGQTNYCVNISVKAWVKNNDYWTVYYQFMKEVHTAFNENNITMPVQQIEIKNK